MTYISSIAACYTDLCQYAQHVETITEPPTAADFVAINKVSELCASICDHAAALQSEVLHQKNQLAEVHPVAYDEFLRSPLRR